MSERNRVGTSKALLGILMLGLCAAPAPAQITGGQVPVTQPGAQQPGAQQPGAQQPGTQQPGTQQPVTQPGLIQPFEQPNLPGQLLNGGSPQGGGQGGPDEFTSIWSRPTPPEFSGFPIFPARLPGYGNYPLPATGAAGDPNAAGPLIMPLPRAKPEPPGWPTWVRTQAKRPLPFDISLGLLISQEGRVWHRDNDGEPFVPLFFHDKFAALPVGATVESRGTGAFEVLLERTTRIQTRGRTTLKPLKLDAETVHVKFDELSWLRLTCSARTNRFTLPDGSTIEMAASEAAPVVGLMGLFGMPALAAPQRPPLVEIRRADEPGWYGGRATISNLGGVDIIWKHAFGETRIVPDHRVTFFLSQPTAATLAGLTPGDTRLEHDGETVTCKSTKDTEVQWCGARIQLQQGESVTLESLGGSFSQQPGGATAPAGTAVPTPVGTPGPSGTTGG